MLYDADLINAIDFSDSGEYSWKAKSLTWHGHDFLDAARDDKRWEKAKSIALKKAGTVTFDILKQVLVSLIKGAIFPDT